MWDELLIIGCIALLLQVGSAENCSTSEDCDEESYFECTAEKMCECSEFFVLDPSNSSVCLKGASFNQSCRENVQCTSILGPASFCNPTRNKCECTGEAVHFDRRCYVLKAIGEGCTEDLQCMLGRDGNQSTNALGRCLQGRCGCLTDSMTSSWELDGKCVTCENCTTVEISLFAIMFPGTVVLILFVYVMYRIGSHGKGVKKAK